MTTNDIALLAALDVRIAASGEASAPLLRGASFSLQAGEIVDITGPSGSGKTTFLRALARLMPGAAATLLLQGEPAEKIEPQAWRSKVALLPQKPAIVDGTIADNLRLPWRLKVRHDQQPPSDDELTAALTSVGLADIAIARDASRLSVGQQARIALLRVMLTAPLILLLDEPDAALDEVSATAVRERVRAFAEQGGGVVRVRHRGDDGLAGRRLRLEAGSLTEEA